MDTVVDAVADAFTSVSVLVAAMFVLFGLVRVRWGAVVETMLTRRARTGPFLAVTATLPPGCLGVLAVSRLYVQGSVSYGTVIAALVSTMGDTAWLLLAKDPLLTVVLKGSLAALGCVVGLVVDRLGVRPRDAAVAAPAAVLAHVGASGADSRTTPSPVPRREHLPGVGAAAGPADEHHPRHHDVPPLLTTLFLTCLAVGLVVSLPSTLHLLPDDVTEGPSRLVGLLGTVAALAVVVAARGRLRCGEEDNAVERRVSEVLRNGSREAAFVTVWVSAVFVAWELGSAHVPHGLASMPIEGVVGVVVAAAAGLVPACGVEIVVAALFVTGVLPLAALVAYLVSQDGNGFIPIATVKPRSMVHGEVLTTALALVVGLGVLALS